MARRVEGVLPASRREVLRLGVVGGRLQGTEAAHLGAAAGYEVVLVDRRPNTPASGLAAESHVFDVRLDRRRARDILGSCDVVVPACEDLDTLRWLDAALPSWGVPLAFHLPSYEVTCSKIASNALFAALDIPRPLPWPECGFPVVVKPSGASGSAGVRVARDGREVAEARAELAAAGHDVVVEQFVAGPSLSLEVVRTRGGVTTAFLPTSLEFDTRFDCKRVSAPVDASVDTLDVLRAASCRLAEHLGLVGLMDVEAMVDGDVPRVIEIDARLPSQTPTAVYHSCGLNLLQALVEAVAEGVAPARPPAPTRGVCYQHVRAASGTLAVLGEHVMATAGPLRLARAAFGADEIITDRRAGATSWSATVICTGAAAAAARVRAAEATRRLALEAGLRLVPEEDGPAVS